MLQRAEHLCFSQFLLETRNRVQCISVPQSKFRVDASYGRQRSEYHYLNLLQSENCFTKHECYITRQGRLSEDRTVIFKLHLHSRGILLSKVVVLLQRVSSSTMKFQIFGWGCLACLSIFF